MKYYAKTLMPKLKNYKIGIVSNNTKQVLIPTCRHFKLKYDVLIADEDLKQGQTKPDAIIKAMKKLRVKKSEALYVGDHLNDIEAARKAGVKCVIIPKGVFTTTNIKRHNPDYVIPNINKLAEILK
jgi:HAD superfamily hydrolase (TIGR01549 family)